MSSQPQFRYKVYGLVVDSEVELPELVPSEDPDAHVHIRLGDVPKRLENLIGRSSWYIASSSELVLKIDEHVSYHVSEGRRITIQQPPRGSGEAVAPADLRLWLLGSAFGALLHQRGLTPMHVSAIKAPSGVWVFTGESGEGKSTLAGFLKKRFGWDLFSDDVAVISAEHSEQVMYPGPRKLKLWEDALAHLEFSGVRAERDLSNTDKFQLYLPCDGLNEPQPVAALVVLETGAEDSEPRLQEVRGAAAFAACCDAVYRPMFHSIYKRPDHLMTHLLPFSQAIQVFRFSRPRSLVGFESNLGPLVERMQQEAAP